MVGSQQAVGGCPQRIGLPIISCAFSCSCWVLCMSILLSVFPKIKKPKAGFHPVISGEIFSPQTKPGSHAKQSKCSMMQIGQ